MHTKTRSSKIRRRSQSNILMGVKKQHLWQSKSRLDIEQNPLGLKPNNS